MPAFLKGQVVASLSATLDCELRIVQAESWRSPRFTGQRMVLAADTDLPTDVESINVTIPGGLIVDAYRQDARLLAVLALED